MATKRSTTFAIQFKDPSAPSLIGGRAFDRLGIEIGVNVQQSNSATAAVSPTSVLGGMTFVSLNPLAALASKDSAAIDRVKIDGVARGASTVRERRIRGRDLVSFVFAPQEDAIPVALHIVSDPSTATQLTIAEAQAIFDDMRLTWLSQANVNLTLVQLRQTTLGFGSSAELPDEEVLFKNFVKNEDAFMNIYFVPLLFRTQSDGTVVEKPGATSSQFDPGTCASIKPDIYLEVTPIYKEYLKRNAAHEAGHALGLTNTPPCDSVPVDYDTPPERKYELMWHAADGGKAIIPRQGNKVNPVF